MTEDEKRKVETMATLHDVDVSELLYFRSVAQLVRQYDQLFPDKETPTG